MTPAQRLTRSTALLLLLPSNKEAEAEREEELLFFSAARVALKHSAGGERAKAEGVDKRPRFVTGCADGCETG